MDLNDFTTEQIKTALQGLVDAGRLVGTVYVDGALAVNTGINPVPEWDENGWSIETRHNGLCVRNRAVEMFLDDLAANGDKFDKAAAAEAPHWFAVMLPWREYTDEQELLLDRSRPERYQFISGWLGGMMWAPFYPESTEAALEAAPITGPDGIITPVLGDAADDDYLDVVDSFKHRVKGAARRARRAAIGSGNPTFG